MDDMASINDAGLNSLSGFSYQIKVFIFWLTQIRQGQRVEFETLDDVAVSSLSSKDSVSDSCFKWSINENSSAEVFQVKQTNVTESVGRQVMYNWLLAYSQKPTIAKFTLYIAHGYLFKANTFTSGAAKEYQVVMESDKSPTALVTRVKQLYQDEPTKFEQDYQTICSNKKSFSLESAQELWTVQVGAFRLFVFMGSICRFVKKFVMLFRLHVILRTMNHLSKYLHRVN